MSLLEHLENIRNKSRILSLPRKNIALGIFSILLLISLPIIVFVSTREEKQETRSQAAETSVDSLNAQILQNNSSKNYVINKFLLEQRKEIMLKLAYESPAEFLNKAINSDTRNKFPEDQRSLIEEKKQVSGKLVVGHKDNFKEEKVKMVYYVQNNKTTQALKTPSDLPEETAITGTDVTVNGYKLDTLLVASNDSISLTSYLSGSTNSVSEDNPFYLVIPINFRDDRSKPYSMEEIANRLFSGNNSGRKYYLNISENTIEISGVVVPWQESNIYKSTVCDNGDQMIDYAYSNFNVSSYSGLIFIFPNLGDCDWSGMGTIGGNPKIVWLNTFDLRTITHEMGHSLGMHHATRAKCKAPNCEREEYGDKSDTMGSQFANLNGSHIISLGLMKAAGLKLFSGNGTFTLHKLNGNSVPQVLMINDSESNKKIFVEFRGSNSKYSQGVPYKIDEGVLVYRWDGNWYSKTALVDITNGDGIKNNLVLKDGQSVEIGPVRIKQISHGLDAARIHVEKR